MFKCLGGVQCMLINLYPNIYNNYFHFAGCFPSLGQKGMQKQGRNGLGLSTGLTPRSRTSFWSPARTKSCAPFTSKMGNPLRKTLCLSAPSRGRQRCQSRRIGRDGGCSESREVNTAAPHQQMTRMICHLRQKFFMMSQPVRKSPPPQG